MGGPVTSVLQCCVPAAAAVAESWDAGHFLIGLLGAEAGPWLQCWLVAPVVSHCHGLWPLVLSQTQQHQAALPQGDSGDLLPCLTDALPAAQ